MQSKFQSDGMTSINMAAHAAVDSMKVQHAKALAHFKAAAGVLLRDEARRARAEEGGSGGGDDGDGAGDGGYD